MKYNDYRFNLSTYQRPGCKHVCGRSGLGKQSCWQGPDHQGHCGGSSECQPQLKGGGYVCTRPLQAGGPCDDGPGPDGSCAHSRPPCKPRLSLRTWRGRLTLLASAATLATIALFSTSHLPNPFQQNDAQGGDGDSPVFAGSMLHPGPLSDQHQAFMDETDCKTCHQPHGEDALGWIKAAFSPQTLSKGCLDCHDFEGMPLAAHQLEKHETSDGKAPAMVACHQCHEEHKGSGTDLISSTNQQCVHCHDGQFEDFAGHPDFGEDYPHHQPQASYFNHLKHINEYFAEDKWLDKPNRDRTLGEQAATDCTVCHRNADSTRKLSDSGLSLQPYEAMCAGCHEQQITDRQLVAMLPDEISPILLGLGNTEHNAELADQDGEELAGELLSAMAEEGLAPLLTLAGDKAEEDEGLEALLRLWSGISPLEVQQAATGWLEEEDFEVLMEEQQAMAGWHLGETEDGDQALFYRPKGHGDVILRAWIETYLKQKQAADGEDSPTVDVALGLLLDGGTGPGACGKCHGRPLLQTLIPGMQTHFNSQTNPGMTPWQSMTGKLQLPANASQTMDYTQFRHGRHIGLMGNQESCVQCHEFNRDSDFAAWFKTEAADFLEALSHEPGSLTTGWQSHFQPIQRDQCSECHSEGRIAASCLTCHDYHKTQNYMLNFSGLNFSELNGSGKQPANENQDQGKPQP